MIILILLTHLLVVLILQGEITYWSHLGQKSYQQGTKTSWTWEKQSDINLTSYVSQFSLQDNVQDLRQIVLDRPESCYRTCFSLQMDGVRLDDFAELHMIEGLKDDTTIKVVEGTVYVFRWSLTKEWGFWELI